MAPGDTGSPARPWECPLRWLPEIAFKRRQGNYVTADGSTKQASDADIAGQLKAHMEAAGGTLLTKTAWALRPTYR